MALILQLETGTSSCSVALAADGQVLAIKEQHEANIHASHLTLFIDEVLKAANRSYEELDAVAVSMGPGSYTGLRIGVSTAKGLCFALDIPLLAIPTLQAMASAKQHLASKNTLLCPMIDARRMEVYSGVYDANLIALENVKAVILDEHSFDAFDEYTLIFLGDGAEKCKTLYSDPLRYRFEAHVNSAADMTSLAFEKFTNGEIEDLAYFEPYYLKDFMVTQPKKK
ncbi:MAG: tRNA (adenosine(37)-N6)-threonylcarbamoyltransferase complex dimerization subunit type 1 TsaB [Sphingobacteriaceae bacterium]